MMTIQDENTGVDVPIEQFWQQHVKLKQASGLSRVDYCNKHKLVRSKFAYWEQKLKQCGSKLLPVKVFSSQASTVCTLLLKNGNQLQVHDPLVLPMLISLLG